MTSEEFLERFNEGKISYKLPSKYPDNFALCKCYNDGKREVPLAHKDKVEKVLKECYAAVKPVLKKFKLSLALLVESEVTYKGVAWTKKIKVNFSNPTDKDKKEELIAYTNMIQIKIRNKDHPQNPKMFLNRTTVLAIMLHELAHLRHMDHSINFALFLQKIYLYAMTLGLFSENEEHMIPSSRPWERRMFEAKGHMTREELEECFKNVDPNGNDDSLEHEHGHGHGDEPVKQENEEKKASTHKIKAVEKSSEAKAKVPLKSSNVKINKEEVNKEKIIKSVNLAKSKPGQISDVKTTVNMKPKVLVGSKTDKVKKSSTSNKKKDKKEEENKKETDDKEEDKLVTVVAMNPKGEIVYSERVIDAEKELEELISKENSKFTGEDVPMIQKVNIEGDKGSF